MITDDDRAKILTYGELHDAALRVLPGLEQLGVSKTGAAILAQELMGGVIAGREREYKTLDIVRDALQQVWERASTTHWRKIGQPGLFAHEVPARPLELIDSPADRMKLKAKRASEERIAESFTQGRTDG